MSKAPALEILAPLRSAIIAETAIASKLGKFSGAASVHTRRPVPQDAGYPLVVIGPIVARTDSDGINTFKPEIIIDINTYGESAHYRVVEQVADLIYSLFHRQRDAISVTNYSVIDIRAQGPSVAPTDEATRVGRRVTLTIRLFAS